MFVIRAVTVYCVVGIPSPVSAQPAGAQAEVLFREGRKLMAAGQTAEACAAFEQSQQLEPAVGTLINLAACREKLDQLATAWGLFLDAERQTRSASGKATQQLNKVARDRAARLEPRVPKLTISVPEGSRIDGLEVLRDQQIVPEVMWNRAIPVDGGTYTITARFPGKSKWSTQVEIASESDSKTVDIPDLRSFTAGAAQPPDPPRPRAITGDRRSLVPIALGAGAAAMLGGALGAWEWGDSTYDGAKAERVNQARRESLYDSAKRKRYAAEGLAVAGVGCAGVAVWLYLRQRSVLTESRSPRAGYLRLAPVGWGLGIAGRF